MTPSKRRVPELMLHNPQSVIRCPFCMGRLKVYDPPLVIPPSSAMVVTYSVERGNPNVLVTIAVAGLARGADTIEYGTFSHECPMQYPSTPHVE